MIGDASTVEREPSGPASTGQQPTFSHSPAKAAAHSGGSVSDTNAPPDTVMIMCAATSANGSASSRRPDNGPSADDAPSADVSLATVTVTRAARHGPGSSTARTAVVPVSGRRVRVTSPSRSAPPGIANGIATPSLNSEPPTAVTVTSRSIASSHTPTPAPPTSALPTSGPVRRCTCRNRAVTPTETDR